MAAAAQKTNRTGAGRQLRKCIATLTARRDFLARLAERHAAEGKPYVHAHRDAQLLANLLAFLAGDVDALGDPTRRAQVRTMITSRVKILDQLIDDGRRRGVVVDREGSERRAMEIALDELARLQVNG